MDRAPAPVEIWERRHGAACAPLFGYLRREPEKTVLHAVVGGSGRVPTTREAD